MDKTAEVCESCKFFKIVTYEEGVWKKSYSSISMCYVSPGQPLQLFNNVPCGKFKSSILKNSNSENIVKETYDNSREYKIGYREGIVKGVYSVLKAIEASLNSGLNPEEAIYNLFKMKGE